MFFPTYTAVELSCSSVQSLVADESFQHILRVLNTNVDGKQKIMFAMTAIRGIGRRFSNLACKKAEVDMRKRWAFKEHCTGSLHVLRRLPVCTISLRALSSA